MPLLSNNTLSSIQTDTTSDNIQDSRSQLDYSDLYKIEHSPPKTTILHLIASAITVPNKPDHDDVATVSTAESTTASTVSKPAQKLLTDIDTELSDSTVYSLIQTNPSFIITPDEFGLTPLHIVSRNIFSPISTLTISNVSVPSTISSNSNSGSSTLGTPNNNNGSAPSTISSNDSKTFEKSKILLQNMMDTIMPVDSSPDYLSSLTLSASSFKDNQGNNPLHELVTSFWKSRLSSISALTQTMNIIEDIRKQPPDSTPASTSGSAPNNDAGLTFPIISVPALIPLQYTIKYDTNSSPSAMSPSNEPTANLSELTMSILSSPLVAENESIQSQPTRKSILFFNKDKTQDMTITLFNSSETSIPLSEYGMKIGDKFVDFLTKSAESSEEFTNITKEPGIDAQFARDFFTPQTSAYSSVEEIFKTLMETEDGLAELPFAEFKNQTNDQGHYPIDTFVDFMTTYERYLVDNFKFKTAPGQVEQNGDLHQGEIVLRLNKSAPGKMQGLTNILLLLTPDEDVLKETDEKTPTQGPQAENVVTPAVVTQDTSEKDGDKSEYKTKMMKITKNSGGDIELTIKIPPKIVIIDTKQNNNVNMLDAVAQLVAPTTAGDTFYVISGSFTYNNDGIPLLNVNNQISTTTDKSLEFQNYTEIDLSSIINNITTNQIINKDSSLLRMIELLLSPSDADNNDEYKILRQDIIENLKQKITGEIPNTSENHEFKLTFKKVDGNDSLTLKLCIRINQNLMDETQKLLSTSITTTTTA